MWVVLVFAELHLKKGERDYNNHLEVISYAKFLPRDARNADLARYSCRNPACPCVRPSFTRVLREKTKQTTADMFIPYEWPIILFLAPTVIGERRPHPLKFAFKVTHPVEKR